MCLAVPGRVVRWLDRDPTFARAEIDFGGVRRACHMACVRDAEVDDYVIVHAGIAISLVDPEQAARTLRELAALGELERWQDELHEPPAEPSADEVR